MIDWFYRSKNWCGLMAVLRLERVNADGFIICEHCGKPIVNKYDCIGHHVIELTNDNVNDANIALNPANIMLVHHKCHNIIHNKLGLGKGYKEVYLVYGPPLSGKTTLVRESMNVGDLVVDMDNIWQCVSGCERYEKPPRLKGVVFGVRDQLLDCVRYRRGNWCNAYVIGGYPLISERERLVRSLGAREIFVDTPKKICLERLYTNENLNKAEWQKYVEDWFEKYAPLPPLG